MTGPTARPRAVRTRPRNPAAVALGLFCLAGCLEPDPVGAPPSPPSHAAATAPDAPTAVPSPAGPWFVDRAPDFGLDVVTRCGSPEKWSVLDSLGTGVALFDADGDGDLDLFVAAGSKVESGAVTCAGGPWLFRNDGPGRWSDVTEASGLRYTGWAQGAAVCDYDGDGDLDLFVTNYLEIDPLDPPELVSYYGREALVFQGPEYLQGQSDRLWRNRGDGTFEDVTAASGLDNPHGKGMSALFADLDGDGLPDLFVTNDTQANELYRNLGGGKFREEAVASGVAYSDRGTTEAGMAIALADLDGDGRLDLARTNFHHQGTRVVRGLNESEYLDISLCSGVHDLTSPYVGWGLIAADFDSDGRPDLFQANGHVFPKGPDDPYDQPPLFLRNLDGNRFEDRTGDWGPALDAARSGRAVASGDIDGDGDVDLVVTTIDGPLRLLVNEGPRRNHSVTIRLVGRPPNTDAIGARVEVFAGGRARVDLVKRGGSIFAASDSALHFGLGGTTKVDHVRVVWPDGSAQNFSEEEVPVDATSTIRQGFPLPEVKPYAGTGPTAADRS